MMNPTTDSIDATLFGMPVRTGRWVFVLAGMLMNVCLGTVYAWSVFRAPVAKLFSTADVPITAKQTLWPFMLFLALFTVLMPISGRIVQKVHPRTVSLVGSLIVAAGWILSGYATGMPWLYLTYGVLAGTGVGIVYGIPIAVVTKWFPDIKGLAVGLTVLGFGVSALVTAPLAQALIETKGILNTFFILGIGFLVALVLMSLILRFPPAGWRPEGWQGAAAAASERNYTVAEMLRYIVLPRPVAVLHHRLVERIDGHRHFQQCGTGDHQTAAGDGGGIGLVLRPVQRWRKAAVRLAHRCNRPQ